MKKHAPYTNRIVAHEGVCDGVRAGVCTPVAAVPLSMGCLGCARHDGCARANDIFGVLPCVWRGHSDERERARAFTCEYLRERAIGRAEVN